MNDEAWGTMSKSNFADLHALAEGNKRRNIQPYTLRRWSQTGKAYEALLVEARRIQKLLHDLDANLADEDAAGRITYELLRALPKLDKALE
jgi:hypothetical protein